MRFSCITTTFRYGGVDILTASLARQTFESFECIFVDELYDERKDVVESYLRDHGVWDQVIHVPPKERGDERRIGMQNGRNTGLLFAEGDYAVQLDDYTLLAPDALARFDRLHQEHPSDVLLGIRRTYDPPSITDETGLITTYDEPLEDVRGMSYDPYDLVAENQGVMKVEQIEYVLNLGCLPLDPLVETGGFDERYDCGHGHDDADMMYRMFELGRDAWMDTSNVNAHVDHPTQPTPETDRNAVHLQERLNSGRTEADNDFDFAALRERMLEHKDALRRGERIESLPLQW
jgi:glycosyltransferase involved in cell wall biosynthesis